MRNLVIVRLAEARPRIGEIVTPGVYFFQCKKILSLKQSVRAT